MLRSVMLPRSETGTASQTVCGTGKKPVPRVFWQQSNDPRDSRSERKIFRGDFRGETLSGLKAGEIGHKSGGFSEKVSSHVVGKSYYETAGEAHFIGLSSHRTKIFSAPWRGLESRLTHTK